MHMLICLFFDLRWKENKAWMQNAVCVNWIPVKEFKWKHSHVRQGSINSRGCIESVNRSVFSCWFVIKHSVIACRYRRPGNGCFIQDDWINRVADGMSVTLKVKKETGQISCVHLWACNMLLVIKARSWIYGPDKLQGCPLCLCNPKDTVGRLW